MISERFIGDTGKSKFLNCALKSSIDLFDDILSLANSALIFPPKDPASLLFMMIESVI